MEFEGYKKFIIEATEKSFHFGLLIFEEETRRGTLKIYNVDFQEKNLPPSKYDFVESIIDKAMEICKEERGVLYTY